MVFLSVLSGAFADTGNYQSGIAIKRNYSSRQLVSSAVNAAFLTLCRVHFAERTLCWFRKEEQALDQKVIGKFLKDLRKEKWENEQRIRRNSVKSGRLQ